MNMLEKIREAVNNISFGPATDPATIPKQRMAIREIADKRHFGMRALAAWLTEHANDANGLVEGAGDTVAIGATGDTCIISGAVYVTMDLSGPGEPVITLMADLTSGVICLAKYRYAFSTDELTRIPEPDAAEKEPETGDHVPDGTVH